MGRRAWVAGAAAAGVLAVGSAVWWLWLRPARSAAPAAASAKVERGALRVAVTATARVVSNLDVDIKCKASGTVVKLPKDISDAVTAGELLLELDPVDEQRSVARAEAALAASEARLDQARRQLAIAEATLATAGSRARTGLASAESSVRDARAKAGRARALLERKLASQEEADTADTAQAQAEAALANAQVAVEELRTQKLALELRRQDIRLAESAVSSDRANLDDARQRLRDTRILAPIDGTVSARSVQVGAIVSSGITNVGGGTTLMTVSDLSRLFALAAVDESDIGRVATGQAVRITADAFPGRRFRGRVVRIATRGVSASNVVTFEVRIEIEGEGRGLLRPEMTTNAEIVVASRDDCLTLPVEALTQRRERWTVQVAGPDGAATEREVTVGISDGLRTEVVEGLDEGASVLLRKGDGASQWRRQQAGMPMMGMGAPPGGRGR
jgi:HlyD family secretion protein